MPRSSLLAIAVALVAALPSAAPAASTGPIATIACTQATINGQSKCIARGQYCSRNARAMRDYRRYGYSCSKRDRNGDYHLQ